MSGTEFSARMRLSLLLAGAAAGLILAASGLVESGPDRSGDLPQHAIARVGGRLIPEDRYRQLLHDLAADKRTPIDAEDRQFVLDRLVDEELLIMRGIELGLAETAPEIRKAVAAAVIAQVAAEAEAAPPDEAALQRLYASDPDYFAATARYRLHWWRLPGDDEATARRAMAAFEQLQAQQPVESVVRSAGWQRQAMLPDQLLPLTKLADYLGPELAQQLPQLATGQYAKPIAAGGSFHLLYLADRQGGDLPPFESVRPAVEAEYLRRAGDRALRDYLAWLRQRTDIVVAPDASRQP
jgi:hypothetical protein